MLKIGLTGGIGSGKTSVSEQFKKHHAAIIDTDIIARQLVNDNAKIINEISKTFGQDILNLDGTLNRAKLAQIIFNVKQSKRQLENILHPEIRKQVIHEIQFFAAKNNPPNYVIIVVPLLLEVNYDDFIDRILVVVADEEKRIERVQQRDNRSASEIRSIISSQLNDHEMLQNADDVIENNGGLSNLKTEVEKLHKKYLQLAQ